MQLGVVGVSYHHTDVCQREGVLKVFQEIEQNPTYREHMLGDHVSWVLLFTCHRVELYYHSESPSACVDENIHSLSESIHRAWGIRPYHHQCVDCFVHLFSVTGGADSLELCETEIQGQVKRCYVQAYTQRKLSSALHFLFQKALKEGKTIRSQCSPHVERYSLVEVVRDLLFQNQKTLDCRFLFIGYSEINRKVAGGLQQYGFEHITFCSRAPHRVPHPCVLRNRHIFQGPFDVFGLGTLSITQEFPNLSPSWFSVHGEQRMIFDFNVPKTFKQSIDGGIQLFDMDCLSALLHRYTMQESSHATRASWYKVFERAAYKQWVMFKKKCSQEQREWESLAVHSS